MAQEKKKNTGMENVGPTNGQVAAKLFVKSPGKHKFLLIAYEFWTYNCWIEFFYHILHVYKILRVLKINNYVINDIFKL